MAKFVATDYKVTINGTNFSTNLTQVELNVESNDVETTAFGTEWEAKAGGLKKGSVTLQFPRTSAHHPSTRHCGRCSPSPPSWSPRHHPPSVPRTRRTATCLVNKYQPFASSVGDLATLSVSWPTTGTVTRGTS